MTVLDGQADGDTKTLPVTSGLGDIFTDLLGGETKRTDLRSESRRGTDLTTSGAEVDNLNLVGIELGSCKRMKLARCRCRCTSACAGQPAFERTILTHG